LDGASFSSVEQLHLCRSFRLDQEKVFQRASKTAVSLGDSLNKSSIALELC